MYGGHWTKWSRRDGSRLLLPSLVCEFASVDYPAGAITTLIDRTLNGVNPTQATAGMRAVNTANQNGGLPAILYDGVDDWHSVAKSLPQPFHLFAVCKISALGPATNHDVPF